MTTASATGTTAALPARLGAGIVGGLVGGVVFGMLMQVTGMITMVAMLVGSTSTAVGWPVHRANSAFIGATPALLLGRFTTSLVRAALTGMGYGVVRWVLGTLMIMPARLGMKLLVVNAAAGKASWGM
jgi:hypothetical protein